MTRVIATWLLVAAAWIILMLISGEPAPAERPGAYFRDAGLVGFWLLLFIFMLILWIKARITPRRDPPAIE
jgi:hypothetical protein